MLIAIERNRFNILYKYDKITIGLNSVLDDNLKDLVNRLSDQKSFDSLVKEFDKILPIFELESELLLLEVDKLKVSFSNELNISFKSIIGIYPLTSEGKNLLFGRLNENIKIGAPVFEKVIKNVKALRTLRFRVFSAKRLIDIFGLTVAVNGEFKKFLQSAIETYVFKDIVEEKNFLAHLLTYNKTPHFLPSGNTEFITKLGVITLLTLNKDENILKNGDFYDKCVEYKEVINEGTFVDGWNSFNSLLGDKKLNDSYIKINNSINPTFEGLNIFKISYYFLAIKQHLNNNEKDFSKIADLIYTEGIKDPTTMIHAIILIGYTFSFEEIYESVHFLEQAPILHKTFKVKNLVIGNKTDTHFQNSERFKNRDQTNKDKFYLNENTKESSRDEQIINNRDSKLKDSINRNMSKEDIAKNDQIAGNDSPSLKDSIHEDAKTLSSAMGKQTNVFESQINKDKPSELTVEHFQNWVIENGPKRKVKTWIALLKSSFHSPDTLITIEDLINVLGQKTESDFFNKSGKSKFTLSSIKTGFFKKE